MERRLKHWFSPKIRGRKHQTVTQRPFSPPSFPARRKRRGRRRRVRNDHDGTSRRKRRLLSSVLISSFPNRELNSRFGGDFDFPSDSLEPTRKTPSVFLDFSRDSLKNQCESVLPNYFFRRTFCRSYSKATAHKSGAPYQAARSKKLVR